MAEEGVGGPDSGYVSKGEPTRFLMYQVRERHQGRLQGFCLSNCGQDGAG